MSEKLVIAKNSFHGQRINHCLQYGLPLNILEAFGKSALRKQFASHADKRDFYILKAAFLFTTPGREHVALFQRLPSAKDDVERLTTGTSLFCGLTPDVSMGQSFEEQILSKVTATDVQQVRILGQGISERDHITYLLTTIEVVLSRRQSLSLRETQNAFLGFVPIRTAESQLQNTTPLDKRVLAFLLGKKYDKRSFIPSAIDCSVQQVFVAGIDIHRFSLLPNHEQVLKFITLKVLLRRALDQVKLNAHTIQTGDGCFAVFESGSAESVLEFCLFLHQRIQQLNAATPGELSLRYALHRGPVYKVHDFNEQVNFIGDGMNYCSRLLGFKEAGVLQVSAAFRRTIRSSEARRHGTFTTALLRIKHQSQPDLIYRMDLDRRRMPPKGAGTKKRPL